MAIVAQKNSKTIPIVVAVLVVIIILALGYYVFKTLRTKNAATNNGVAIDTAALNDTGLKYIQYQPGDAPTPDSTQVGREDPFAPY